MHRRAVRLSLRHRAWVYGSFGVLWLTGIAWLVAKYLLRQESDFGEQPHLLEPWSMKLHGAVAMLALLVLGSLIPVHIRRGWRMKVNTVSGGIMVAVTLLLIVSGFGLYYFGSEGWRTLASWSHIVAGIAFPLVLVIHIVIGVKQATKAAKSGEARP